MSIPFYEMSKSLSSSILKAWQTGNKNIRTIIIIGSILMLLAILVAAIGNIVYPEIEFPKQNSIILYICGTLFIFSAILFIISIAYVDNLEREKNEGIIENKEREVAEHPNKPKLAWDLARIKLERYLNRNLIQVKSIFYLSIFVMLVGFGLIIYGAIMVFKDTANFEPAIVVSISGIIVNFIGASFLVLYKSTMQQAKEYVLVLERINAVGMSVQVIDTIKNEDEKLKDETKAELAKKLIDLYIKK